MQRSFADSAARVRLNSPFAAARSRTDNVGRQFCADESSPVDAIAAADFERRSKCLTWT